MKNHKWCLQVLHFFSVIYLIQTRCKHSNPSHTGSTPHTPQDGEHPRRLSLDYPESFSPFCLFSCRSYKIKETQSCKTLILNKEQERFPIHTRVLPHTLKQKEQSPCAHQSCNLPASKANSFPFLPLHSYVTDICCITLSLSLILVLSPETLSFISPVLAFHKIGGFVLKRVL